MARIDDIDAFYKSWRELYVELSNWKPIYEKGSENVVGLLSSVILNADHEDEPCYIGNEGIGVRVDKNLDFTEQVASNVVLDDVDFSGGTEETIEAVADEIQLRSGNGSTDSQDKLFGIDIAILTKLYLIMWVIFIIFVLRVVIFKKKLH